MLVLLISIVTASRSIAVCPRNAIRPAADARLR
jgi:hypothetical protein